MTLRLNNTFFKHFVRLMGSVYFLPAEIECTIKNEQSILELALKNKIPLDHSCGGSGSCSTCRVFLSWRTDVANSSKVAVDPLVESAQVYPPRGDAEQAMADDRNFAPHERLSCQIEPLDGMIITIPD